MSRLNGLSETVQHADALSARIADIEDLIALTKAEQDESLLTEVAAEAEAISDAVGRLDFQVLLGGDYAENDAILSIHAGAGGTESQDWARRFPFPIQKRVNYALHHFPNRQMRASLRIPLLR